MYEKCGYLRNEFTDKVSLHLGYYFAWFSREVIKSEKKTDHNILPGSFDVLLCFSYIYRIVALFPPSDKNIIFNLIIKQLQMNDDFHDRHIFEKINSIYLLRLSQHIAFLFCVNGLCLGYKPHKHWHGIFLQTAIIMTGKFEDNVE